MAKIKAAQTPSEAQRAVSLKIRHVANAALKDPSNAIRNVISVEQKAVAATMYERIAELQGAKKSADLARLFNLERAQYLRGEVDRIAPDALAFALERGISHE